VRALRPPAAPIALALVLPHFDRCVFDYDRGLRARSYQHDTAGIALAPMNQS
jgi:hypothetical protein